MKDTKSRPALAAGSLFLLVTVAPAAGQEKKMQ